MSWMQSVFSSNVSEVGWEENKLIVVFKNGRRYEYDNVTEETALRMARAPSVGEFLNSEIKGQYDYRRIT